MFQILIDIICIKLSGRVLLKTLDIPMGINCAPLLDDLSIMRLKILYFHVPL
jgi:hypothetical protein